MVSSIFHGCETWCDAIPTEIEKIYRAVIKTALSIRESTNNENVYTEFGLYSAE